MRAGPKAPGKGKGAPTLPSLGEAGAEEASSRAQVLAAAEAEGSRVLAVVLPEDGDKNKALGHKALDSSVKTAAMHDSLTAPLMGTTNMGGVHRALNELICKVYDGDLRQADLMLVSQAYTLDALFTDLLRRWQLNTSHSHQISESYLRLALKTQSQARTTWETIAAMKAPSGGHTFVRQANIANGPQQVNNGGAVPASEGDKATECPGARENENSPIELLEAKDG